MGILTLDRTAVAELRGGDQGEPGNLAGLLGALAQLFNGEPVQVSIRRGTRTLTLCLYDGAPPQAREDDAGSCRADILAVLRTAGRRLTTTQILSDMEKQGRLWGDRTVQGHLADMVADGTLDSVTRTRPRGYWIAGEQPTLAVSAPPAQVDASPLTERLAHANEVLKRNGIE